MAQSLDRTQQLIDIKCEELAEFLKKKNRSYGDSALDPIRIFSKADKAEQIKVRLDDKINRLKQGGEYPGDNEIRDLAGYLILLSIAEDIPMNDE